MEAHRSKAEQRQAQGSKEEESKGKVNRKQVLKNREEMKDERNWTSVLKNYTLMQDAHYENDA